jgi:hypothetical protein
MSEAGEEKEAIELIGEAEKEIRARIDTAQRKAKQIVTDAERRAGDIVRAKESELKALETAGYFVPTKPVEGNDAVALPSPQKELVERLAGEIFAQIIGETAEGSR